MSSPNESYDLRELVHSAQRQHRLLIGVVCLIGMAMYGLMVWGVYMQMQLHHVTVMMWCVIGFGLVCIGCAFFTLGRFLALMSSARKSYDLRLLIHRTWQRYSDNIFMACFWGTIMYSFVIISGIAVLMQIRHVPGITGWSSSVILGISCLGVVLEGSVCFVPSFFRAVKKTLSNME